MKKFDYMILGILFFMAIVSLFVLTGNNKSFSETPVEAVNKVKFDVSLRGVTSTMESDLFVKNEKTFLTIRNVPYKKLDIVNVEKTKRKIAVASNNKIGYMLVDDPTLPYQHDYIITLEDVAKITDDGAVVGGNKIKVGIPVKIATSS